MKILIADDEATSRLMLQAALRQLGHDVLAVEDGTQAWGVLRDHDAPHVAVLDWSMPGVDGLELCRRIRGRVAGHYIYTVLVTSRSGREDMVSGLDAGADDFVCKPFDAKELRARLRTGERILSLEAALTRSRAHLAEVLANIDSGVLLSDPGGKILVANPALERLGAAEGPTLGQSRAALCAQNAPRFAQPEVFLAALSSGSGELNQDFELRTPQRRVLRWTSKPVAFEGGLGHLDVCRDVTSEIDLARVLTEQALTDPLTGLVNRRGGEQGLTREAARFDRGSSQHLCVALLDIDHFKRVNDTLGHGTGDQVLKALASFILRSVRQSDLAVRWGGEEILLLLPDTPLGAARSLVDRLRRDVESLRGDGLPAITFSAGVCQMEAGEAPAAAIARADERLYEAKKAGRNCVK